MGPIGWLSDRGSFVQIRRIRLAAAVIGTTISLSGCLLGLDTGVGFGINQSVVAIGEALPEEASAVGGVSQATVSGRIVGKLPCDEVRGEADEQGNRIRVIITLRADRNFCSGAAPTTFTFVANLLNVDPGDRQIVVEYRYVGVDGDAGVRLDTVVVVR